MRNINFKVAASVLFTAAIIFGVVKTIESQGNKVYDFDFVALENQKSMPLQPLEGKVVFFKAWATWCTACRQQLPYFNQAAQSLPKDRVAVFSVATDTKDAVTAFLRSKPYRFETFLDNRNWLRRELNMRGVPTYYVFDQKRRLKYASSGASNSLSGALSMVDQLLQTSQ